MKIITTPLLLAALALSCASALAEANIAKVEEVGRIVLDLCSTESSAEELAAAAEVRFGERGTFIVKVTGTPDDQQTDMMAALMESAYYVDISTRSMDLALLGDLFPDETNPTITGALEGHAHVAGTLDAPTVDASFNVPALGFDGLRIEARS